MVILLVQYLLVQTLLDQYLEDWPPSIGMTAALMKPASPESRKATSWPTPRPCRSASLVGLDERHTEMLVPLGEMPELWAVISCRFLPWIDQLAAQPVSSWQARFLCQVRSVPSVSEVLFGVLSTNRLLRLGTDLARGERFFGAVSRVLQCTKADGAGSVRASVAATALLGISLPAGLRRV